VLFLTASGEELSPSRLTQLVRDYVNAAGTGKKGACHASGTPPYVTR